MKRQKYTKMFFGQKNVLLFAQWVTCFNVIHMLHVGSIDAICCNILVNMSYHILESRSPSGQHVDCYVCCPVSLFKSLFCQKSLYDGMWGIWVLKHHTIRISNCWRLPKYNYDKIQVCQLLFEKIWKFVFKRFLNKSTLE